MDDGVGSAKPITLIHELSVTQHNYAFLATQSKAEGLGNATRSNLKLNPTKGLQEATIGEGQSAHVGVVVQTCLVVHTFVLPIGKHSMSGMTPVPYLP